MVKAYQHLVQDDTEVSVETGLRAADKLQAAVGVRDTGAELLKIRVEVGRMIEAVKSVVPEHMWADIRAALDDSEPVPPRPDSAEPREGFDPGDEYVLVEPFERDDDDDDF